LQQKNNKIMMYKKRVVSIISYINIKNISRQVSIAFLFVISFSNFAQTKQSTMKMKFGKGVQFTSEDSLFTLAISGRVQSMFEAKHDQTNSTTSADFLLRRCRLNFQGTAFNPKFTYRIQLGFAHGDITSANSTVQNNLVLRDAMLFYKANHWLRFGFGQTKLPGNRQRQVSSANLQLVERSIANNNFTLDRDKGLWIYTHFNLGKALLKSTSAVSSGEGRIISDKNGKLCYSTRWEFLPFGEFTNGGDYIEADNDREATPKIAIAGVYSYNDATSRTMGQLGDYLYNSQIAYVNYYGGDLLFKYKGFSFESEYYTRNSNRGVIINKKDTTQRNNIIAGNTLMLQSGYFITKTNEIAVRYAQITPDKKVEANMNTQKEYVLGFSHYFNNHSLKLQSDISYLENGKNQSFVYRLSGVVTF
jgi:phosphate-selective porin OprO and OprP